MKKIYSIALAAAVALTASANTKVAKVANAEIADEVSALKVRTATEAILPAEAVDYSSLTWKSLGKGVYAASVLADTYAGSTDPVEVEIYEANEQPGVYKAVGVWPDLLKAGTAALIVDATNPKCVKVPKQNTGLQDNVDGITYIASQSWILADKGYSDDQIISALTENNLLPVLVDKIISFPPMSLLLNWPEAPEDSKYQTDPTKWYGGKSAGLLALPGAEVKLPWEEYGEATISGDFLMTAFGATPATYTVPVYQSTSNTAQFRVDDALKGLYASKNWQATSPSMTFDLTVPDNVVLPLTSTGINGGTTDGLYSLLTINQNYETIADCPEESRTTSVKDEGNITISIPVKGLLLYAATSQKLYYANSQAAKIEIKKKNNAVNDIVVDVDENAPVEYYNLQGVRVAEPKVGSLVIRRQGSNVTKVLVK